jgi:hypothetical protein
MLSNGSVAVANMKATIALQQRKYDYAKPVPMCHFQGQLMQSVIEPSEFR